MKHRKVYPFPCGVWVRVPAAGGGLVMPELDLDDTEDYYIISPEAEADAADLLPAIQRRISEIYHHTVMQELLNP